MKMRTVHIEETVTCPHGDQVPFEYEGLLAESKEAFLRTFVAFYCENEDHTAA